MNNDLMNLIGNKKYKAAKQEISKIKGSNPPFYESLEAYVSVMDMCDKDILHKPEENVINNANCTNSGKNHDRHSGTHIECIETTDVANLIERTFGSVIKKYPTSPDLWKILSAIYSDNGYHEKAKNALKECFRLGAAPQFVFGKLFCYSLYFKDLEMIEEISRCFSKEKMDFIRRFFKGERVYTKLGNKDAKFLVSQNSMFNRFKRLTIIKEGDKIKVPCDDKQENVSFSKSEHTYISNPVNLNLNNESDSSATRKDVSIFNCNKTYKRYIKGKIALRSIEELKSIYKKDLEELMNYFIDYEFKLFFHTISKELYTKGYLEIAAYSLNAFFRIQSNQMDYLNFYFALFEENRFQELECLLDFKNDYLVNESIEFGRILLRDLKRLDCRGSSSNDLSLDESVARLKLGLPNSIAMLRLYCEESS